MLSREAAGGVDAGGTAAGQLRLCTPSAAVLAGAVSAQATALSRGPEQPYLPAAVRTWRYDDPHMDEHGVRMAIECLREVGALCLPLQVCVLCAVWYAAQLQVCVLYAMLLISDECCTCRPVMQILTGLLSNALNTVRNCPAMKRNADFF